MKGPLDRGSWRVRDRFREGFRGIGALRSHFHPADRNLTGIPGVPPAGLAGRAKYFHLEMEGIRGRAITCRSGERYGSYDQTDISLW